MIATELARALRDSGLRWHPAAGDAFRIDMVEVDADVFILSDMTVETHDFPTGTVIGFNGTTEWALDSVDLDDALWMPHEHQLRRLLSTAFRSLEATPAGFRVVAVIDGNARNFDAEAAEDAYGRALLAYIDSAVGLPDDGADDELAQL